MDKKQYDNFVKILRAELIPAMGCTEPIAIAYAAAKARQVLGKMPDRVVVEASGNIIKNVKSVVVPNTGRLKGIRAAVAAGVIAGEADQQLQVISSVSPEFHPDIAVYANDTSMEIVCADTPWLLDIQLTGWKGEDRALVRIADTHANVVRIEKNDEIIFDKPLPEPGVLTRGGIDVWFFLIVLGLVLYGVIMAYSASSIYAAQYHDDSTYFIKKHLMYLALAMVGTAPFVFMARPWFWKFFAIRIKYRASSSLRYRK